MIFPKKTSQNRFVLEGGTKWLRSKTQSFVMAVGQKSLWQQLSRIIGNIAARTARKVTNVNVAKRRILRSGGKSLKAVRISFSQTKEKSQDAV
jgi:hypothetical protein